MGSAWRSTTSPEKGSSRSAFRIPSCRAVPHAAIVTVKRTASRIGSSELFEHPDGIRLEVNHVPGKGLLG